jgi:hypothetical protein
MKHGGKYCLLCAGRKDRNSKPEWQNEKIPKKCFSEDKRLLQRKALKRGIRSILAYMLRTKTLESFKPNLHI